jgi:hypothetical protein
VSVVLSQQDILGLAVVAIFGVIILRRTALLIYGVPATTGRLVFLSGLYGLFYGIELLSVAYAGIGSGRGEVAAFALTADLLLVGVGIAVAYPLTRRHVVLYQTPGDPRWFYRLRPLLPVVYVVLFFIRAGLEVAIVGESPFTFPSASEFDALSTVALATLFVVDALWGLTTGFLLGRNAAVYGEWQRHERSASPSAPLPPS